MQDAASFLTSSIDDLNLRFGRCRPEELLEWAAATFGEHIALCSAFGPESMVLLHCLSKIGRKMKVFTLDTGRLPQETHDLMQKCEDLYGLKITVYSPDAAAIREMVRAHGINLFLHSVAHRELCCETRKVRPLIEALQGLSA